ncbi:MBL fold metallo-hydrolase [Olivibacter sp. SDN3]|uniref:MBL fold metallo-hydrolase n=1 Tax=Olivibacter sp. SDN3 TaxID=2764720 RepID=UPI0016519E81|nr:MBL fold metallo-hydrolase [Olivibacter sp. SDN3]QNL49862.1 MBL fold metallo-hydrolase [Olivibacter sp. SDN3]
MHIEQFYDTGLAHSSYAILSNNDVVLVDPARDPEPYFAFARENHAKIVGVIETHPHADFVSSHLEIHQKTGATIYTSELTGAEYPHRAFDEGDVITVGNITLQAINTPGHSPDSICVLLLDEQGKESAVFTGDTLFVGDVGRPDLRENVGNLQAEAAELARAMFHSLRNKLMRLPADVVVYPAHGPGSLCGKNMGSDLQSTIGRERSENYALQKMEEEAFVALITADQPFVPKYFPYDVALNRAGAEAFDESVEQVIAITDTNALEPQVLIIDGRPAEQFKNAHHPMAINIPDGDKFETWVGSIVSPGESFYLLTDQAERATELIKKLAKIGYENQCKGFFISPIGNKKTTDFDLEAFKSNPQQYTIIDIRNDGELAEGKLFSHAIHIPLPRLRESLPVIPEDKPIVVHCAGGYRSAIGSSIVAPSVQVPVYDLSTAVSEFKPNNEQ